MGAASSRRLGPGGIIYRFSPDGKHWELYASGFRNIFDGGFNRDGELFTYDADMEYDFNTSWYRPTRINHVTSGSEWGWRNGAGKRPEFYPDNLSAALNIGPGSPTGMTFGYGAKFPAKYQNALFALDWSWGKLYAIHLQPKGSSLRRDEGRISFRRAAAADRRDHSSRRRRDVFRHRRAQGAVGILSRDLHGQGIDRAGETVEVERIQSARSSVTRWKHFTANKIRRR